MVDFKHLDAELNPPVNAAPAAEAQPTEGTGTERIRPFAEHHTFSLQDLNKARDRLLLDVANLPHGHGWGSELQDILGGGLGAGDVVAIGAAKAGAGKTAFTQSAGDGLAMRAAELAADSSLAPGQPLTPVLFLSEMTRNTLAHRTLAHLTGAPVNVFRAGETAVRLHGRRFRDEARARSLVEQAYADAAAHMQPGGAFAELLPWVQIARPQPSSTMLEHMKAHVGAWRESIGKTFPTREVLPVVVVDPIQRWQPPGVSEVEALNQLVEELDHYADAEGWIVLLTSDTNKNSGKNADKNSDEAPVSAADVFRGSYKLNHSAESTLVLSPDDPVDPSTDRLLLRPAEGPWEDRPRAVNLLVDKNRNGPAGRKVSFMWHPASGRFRAEDPAETEVRREEDRKRVAAAENGTKHGAKQAEQKAASVSTKLRSDVAAAKAAWDDTRHLHEEAERQLKAAVGPEAVKEASTRVRDLAKKADAQRTALRKAEGKLMEAQGPGAAPRSLVTDDD